MSGLWDGIDWDAGADPSLPPGVIEVCDDNGNWWRYPLAEFTEDGAPARHDCRVYWGSHGCDLERGHEGDCDCGCCDCGDHHPYPEWPDTRVLCVAKAPYYGPETRFYGDDVAARGLPEIDGD